ncbi:hypothetical protein E4U60_003410 [Claviceps pazoutovae]|uniref:Uncharacterized protein n=1 Tax=Claviceps pazoutovae TaxID=1649127 RepID=A0A9P7MAH1_9HYPO|nr:hypothetical protein E4U60_003410 [Claviceps pazoutovae]
MKFLTSVVALATMASTTLACHCRTGSGGFDMNTTKSYKRKHVLRTPAESTYGHNALLQTLSLGVNDAREIRATGSLSTTARLIMVLYLQAIDERAVSFQPQVLQVPNFTGELRSGLG